MKYLLFFLIAQSSYAFESKPFDDTDSHVFQVSKKADISSFKVKKNYLKDLPKKKSILSREYRDQFLTKYLPKKSKKWDELDRDLFVKRLTHYPQKQFLKKYEFINSKTYKNLKTNWQPNV